MTAGSDAKVSAAKAPETAGSDDAAWGRLSRRLGQLQGFGYIVLFVADPALLSPFKTRLADWLAARHWPWVQIHVGSPDVLAERSIERVFEAVADTPPPRLVWLEAQRGAGQAAWEQARTVLLSRLNERRGRLEAELPGTLLLVLPEGAQRAAAALAPDLWHVRSLGLSLGGAVASIPAPGPRSDELAAGRAGAATRDVTGYAAAVMPGPRLFAEAFPDESRWAIARAEAWRQRWTSHLAGRELAAVPLDDDGLRALPLPDGLEAVASLAGHGRLPEALALAEPLAALAQRRLEAGGGLLDIATMRDRASALMALAELHQRAGHAVPALAAAREAVDVCRTLVARLGETPTALRDLARALDLLARLARVQGERALATTASADCVTQCRRLALRQGETPDAQRTLAQALDHAGFVAQSQGDWLGAGAAYEECLSILHAVDARLGGTPQSRLELAAALDRIGCVADAMGDWSRAAEAFDEAVQLRPPPAAPLDGGSPPPPQAESPSP